MELPPRDFESRASTNFTTPAISYIFLRGTFDRDCNIEGIPIRCQAKRLRVFFGFKTAGGFILLGQEEQEELLIQQNKSKPDQTVKISETIRMISPRSWR
jgi:hypothetical protein